MHISNLNPDQKKTETGVFCVYAAAGFEAGVIVWCIGCHCVQVGDDRPVLEDRCALLSCYKSSCSLGTFWMVTF